VHFFAPPHSEVCCATFRDVFLWDTDVQYRLQCLCYDIWLSVLFIYIRATKWQHCVSTDCSQPQAVEIIMKQADKQQPNRTDITKLAAAVERRHAV